MNYFSILVVSFYFAFASLSCSENTLSSTKTEESYRFEDYLPIKLGEQTVYVQIADSNAERSKGLMDHTHLETNHGMLFVFEFPQKVSFWMKNTEIPLDIGYFDENGRLLEIYKLYPYDETPKLSKSNAIKYALEMNQGWFQAHRIKSYDSIDLKAIEHFRKLQSN
jgi:uncharacterized membrane protein (UPF0127 family)